MHASGTFLLPISAVLSHWRSYRLLVYAELLFPTGIKHDAIDLHVLETDGIGAARVGLGVNSNADLKQEMGKPVLVRTKARLRVAANEHMAMLDRTPERVFAYFQDRRVRYAA